MWDIYLTLYIYIYIYIYHILYMNICEYNSGLKKEEIPALYDNMDRPKGHYAKWNKPDTVRQILYDLTYTWNLK